MLFHTPHLEDKYKGTRMILDMLAGRPPRRPQPRLHRPLRRAHHPPGPGRGLLGRHHPLPDDQGHAGAGGRHGRECTARSGILVNSSADWGPSDPLAVLDFICAMQRRGHAESLIRKVVYDNPLAILQPEPQLPVHAGGIALLRHTSSRVTPGACPNATAPPRSESAPHPRCRWSRPPSASPLSPRGGGRRCRPSRRNCGPRRLSQISTSR